MPRFSETRRVRVDSLRSDPATAPRSDGILLRLIHEAVEGKVPVYVAIVPLVRCRQSDLDYGPEWSEPHRLDTLGGQDKHPLMGCFVARHRRV